MTFGPSRHLFTQSEPLCYLSGLRTVQGLGGLGFQDVSSKLSAVALSPLAQQTSKFKDVYG